MARSVDSGDGWTVGSAKVGGCLSRMAFALCLFGVGGAIGVAFDLLHIPALLGHVVSGRAALLYLARACTIGYIVLGALLARLQWADVHTGGGEVTR